MSNILAIAQKELKAYFASPIAYVVIAAFAFVFAWFYVPSIFWFARESQSGPGMGGGPMNVNQQVIRFLFQNTTVVFLLILPLITMRTYAEEKRTGTMELLLTSPVSDFQILMGKFLGALALYGAMLAVTLIHIGILFIYGSPEWRPVVTGYLGLLLLGGAYISVGLFISSLTRNQIIAAVATFTVFLALWVIDWMSSFVGPPYGSILSALSMTQHLDDFTKGVIDTEHLVYYASFITFGLFLTAKSVDSERWRG
jgi:ABC-2 type transport system permease protein